MPFQLKTTGHHHHGAAMDGKPPPPPAPAPVPPLPAPAPPPRVSRLRRLLVRVSSSDRVPAAADEKPAVAGGGEADVGSVGLDRMVLSFMEESGAAVVERPPRGRCNCFNGSNYEESDDEEDFFLPSGLASAPPPAAAAETLEALKGLVQSVSVAERNLLADASRIAERCGRTCKGKAECRRAVADGLRALGYDAAVCRSRWDKTSYPAGEHEYIDAVVGDEAVRLIVEVDFRSEFEVARSTKAYRAALQALPPLFVGTPDLLGKIVAVVAEAARQSLKKKGLHYPPWRKPEYMRAKWLSPHVRTGDNKAAADAPSPTATSLKGTPVSAASFSGEFELLFGMNRKGDSVTAGEKITVVVSPWSRPTEEASRLPRAKVVTGLSAVL